MNMKKVPTILNLALKALEIVSLSKQKLKPLVMKNPDSSPFRQIVEKSYHFFQLNFFLFNEKV